MSDEEKRIEAERPPAGFAPAGGRDARREIDAPREMIVMLAGGRRFAVFADEVEAVAENLRPAALPFAPAPVLGVVSVRGRMRTVIDPASLFPPNATGARQDTPPARESSASLPFVVALAGDEQLALAADLVERHDGVAAEDLRPHEPPADFARGQISLAGASVTLLDPAAIFEAATRGHERRRKRFKQ